MKTTLLSTLIFGAATLLVSSNSLFASPEKASRAIALELGLESESVITEDTGYGPNNTGAENGIFDWNDANGNGVLDVNEMSERITFSVPCSQEYETGLSKSDKEVVPFAFTDTFVAAVRRAAEKYPDLALDMADVIVASSGGMKDPECAAQIAAAIIQGASLGGDGASFVVQAFVAAFGDDAENASIFFENTAELIGFNPLPDSSGPDSQPQPGPDDVPPSTPAPQPSFSPTPTPAPAPTPVQPSPTPVTPFQNA